MDYTEIRKLMDQLDLTLGQVAKEMNNAIHPSYINKLANGFQLNISRYSKRNAVEKWIKNARLRINRKTKKAIN